jgi:hypothetical protein
MTSRPFSKFFAGHFLAIPYDMRSFMRYEDCLGL